MSARSITPSPVLRCLHLTRPLPSPQTSFMDDLLDIFAQKDDITLSFLETKPNQDMVPDRKYWLPGTQSHQFIYLEYVLIL